jgi:hypothetical protein
MGNSVANKTLDDTKKLLQNQEGTEDIIRYIDNKFVRKRVKHLISLADSVSVFIDIVKIGDTSCVFLYPRGEDGSEYKIVLYPLTVKHEIGMLKMKSGPPPKPHESTCFSFF